MLVHLCMLSYACCWHCCCKLITLHVCLSRLLRNLHTCYIAFGMLMLHCITSPCCMHCIVFGLGVKPNTRNEGRFILEVMKRASILGRRHSWSNMIKCEAFMYFCAFIPYWFMQFGLFGHHASKYVVDDSRVEHYTLLSLKHDKGCTCTTFSCKCIVMPLFVLCCSKRSNPQGKMADQLSSVPID